MELIKTNKTFLSISFLISPNPEQSGPPETKMRLANSNAKKKKNTVFKIQII